MKRRALGKGLGSLLPERPSTPTTATAAAGGGLVEIELDRIVPNPAQPRADFDPEELEDLAASIREAGVLQPILVRATESGYELIAGERRWRAARQAGLRSIPALVQTAEPERSLELALIENIQREQLNPIEEAGAFAHLISEFELTQEQVAEHVGRRRSSVANTLRLLKLPPRVQDLIRERRLTAGHAKALLAIKDEARILAAAETMASGEVTVRAAEQIARRDGAAPGSATDGPALLDPNERDAEIRLQRTLGTRVRIRKQQGGRGRIEISFHNDDELIRLFELLEGVTP